jgi:1-acyl-sn-glycerol-3-phosphate acyltransferase
MGKHTLFQGMMGNFMLDMGGIPIDRTKKANAVDQIAAEYAKREELALVIACEGTRKSDGKWKSGFYNIAQAAGVPIVLACADYEKMIISFGAPMIPTGNYGEDLMKIAEWLRSKMPDYERFTVLEAQARAIIDGRNDV